MLSGFAAKELEPQGFRYTFVYASPNDPNVFPGFEGALQDAGLLFLSVRRRMLPTKQLDAIREHVRSGRPVVALREGTHEITSRKVQNRWVVSYRGIIRANGLLANVGDLDVDQPLKNHRKGEALFLRAWYYFNLTYFYGDVPLFTDVPRWKT